LDLNGSVFELVCAGRYLVDEDSDDDDEGERREVLSKKNKRLEEVRTMLSEIRSKMSSDEWTELHSLFNRLTKAADSASKSLDGRFPRLYFKALAELEDGAQSRGKDDAKGSMTADNFRSLSTMKQKMKKHNRLYEEQVKDAREKSDNSLESADAQEGDTADLSPQEPEEKLQAQQKQQQQRLQRPKAERQRDQVMSLSQDDVSAETVDKRLRETLLARGRKGTDRQEMVERLGHLVTLSRSPPQRAEVLMHVVSAQFDISPSIASHMPVETFKKCALNVYRLLELLHEHRNVKLVEPSAEYYQQQQQQQQYENGDAAGAGAVAVDQEPRKMWLDGYDRSKTYEVYGNVISYVERLDDEHFKTLQCTEPHSPEFVECMRDELPLLQLMSDTAEYAARVGDYVGHARLAQRQIEHLYFKPEHAYESMISLSEERQREMKDSESASVDTTVANGLYIPAKLSHPWKHNSCTEALHSLSATVFERTSESANRRLRARTMLALCYHAALRGDYRTARETMMVSHVQEDVSSMDVSTMVLFNRAMAQLGVAACASGLFSDAASCLAELHASSRIRELLAQGSPPQRYQDRTAEQEREERKRQMPFHMHINLDLLECVHLTSAMLVEVAGMAANAVDFVHGRSTNRMFQRQLDLYEKQTFLGPPESARDHIMASTLALLRGDWERASSLIRSLSVWDLLPVSSKEDMLQIMDERIKRESLKAYLLSQCAHYRSLSLSTLAESFELEQDAVYATVSRMIVGNELHATLDQPSEALVLEHVKPSRLQSLSVAYADKLGVLVEQNEKAADIKTGGSEFSGGRHGGEKQQQFQGERDQQKKGLASRGPKAVTPAQGSSRRAAVGRAGATRQQAQAPQQQSNNQQQSQQGQSNSGDQQSAAAAAQQSQERQFTSLGRATPQGSARPNQ
jgi:translation initiation factor 3 subunit C